MCKKASKLHLKETCDEGKERICLAQNGGHWGASISTLMALWHTQDAWNFSTS